MNLIGHRCRGSRLFIQFFFSKCVARCLDCLGLCFDKILKLLTASKDTKIIDASEATRLFTFHQIVTCFAYFNNEANGIDVRQGNLNIY